MKKFLLSLLLLTTPLIAQEMPAPDTTGQIVITGRFVNSLNQKLLDSEALGGVFVKSISVSGQNVTVVYQDENDVEQILNFNLAGESAGEQNVQSDWNETDTTSDAFIRNKPAVAGEENVQSDWNETNSNSDAFIRNKPDITDEVGARSFDELSGNIFPRQISDGGIQEIKLSTEVRDKINAFSSQDQSKLNAIEPLATADQTPQEIKTAYESNSNTNAFTDAEQTKLSSLPADAEQNVQADWNETDTTSDAFIRNKPTIPTESGGGASSFDQLSGQIFQRQIGDGSILEEKLEQDVQNKLNQIGHEDTSNLDLIESLQYKTSEITFTRHHSFRDISGEEGIAVVSSTGFTSSSDVINRNYSSQVTFSSDQRNVIVILKLDNNESLTDYRLRNTATNQLGNPTSHISASHFVLFTQSGGFSYYVYGSAVDSFHLSNFNRGIQLALQKDETDSVSTVFNGGLPDNSIGESKLSQDVRTKLNAEADAGTEVTANPGGNPQTQLSSIAIDGESYSIPQPQASSGLEPDDRVVLDHITFTHKDIPPVFQRSTVAPNVQLVNQFKGLYREDIRTTGVVNEISNSIFTVQSQPATNQRFYYQSLNSLNPFDTAGSQVYGGTLGLSMDWDDSTNNILSANRIYNFGFQYSLISNTQGVNSLIRFGDREPLLSFDAQRGLIARIFVESSSGGSRTVSETHREYYAVNNAILGTINGQTRGEAQLEFLSINNGQELTVEIVESRNGIPQSQVPPHRTFNLDTSQSRNPVATFPPGTFVNTSKALNVRYDHDAGDNGTLIIHGTEGQDNGYIYEVRVYRNVTTSVTINQSYASQPFGNVGTGTTRQGLFDPTLYDTSQVNRQNNVLLTLRPTFEGSTSTNPLMSIDLSINGHFFTIDTHRTLSDITGVTDLSATNPVLNVGSSILTFKHLYITAGDRPIPEDDMNDATVSLDEYLDFFGFTSSNLNTLNFLVDELHVNGRNVTEVERTDSFVDLDDTPENLGNPGQVVAVNQAGDGLEFVESQSARAPPTLTLDQAQNYVHLGLSDLASSGTGLHSTAPSTLNAVSSEVRTLVLAFAQMPTSNLPSNASYSTSTGQLVLPAGHWIICTSGNFTTSSYNSNSDRVYLELGLFYGSQQRHGSSLYLRNNSGSAIPTSGRPLTGSATVTGAVISDGVTPVTVRIRASAQESETIRVNGVHLHAYKQLVIPTIQ